MRNDYMLMDGKRIVNGFLSGVFLIEEINSIGKLDFM